MWVKAMTADSDVSEGDDSRYGHTGYWITQYSEKKKTNIEYKRWAKWITFQTCCFSRQEILFINSAVHPVVQRVWTVPVCKGQQVQCYIPHKSRSTLWHIRKCVILFGLVVQYYNASNQNTVSLNYRNALIITFPFATLFPTGLDLYFDVIREIFCIQYHKLPPAVH